MCSNDIMLCFLFFKQKTAYEMRISDWSSDVCSSDLSGRFVKWLGGLAEQRTLPRYANQTFTNWFAHRDAPPAPSNAGDVLLWPEDRKSVVQGKSVSVRVDLGGCRMIKKKTILQE